MTPNDAYNYVKSIRPRVLLASAQRQVSHRFASCFDPFSLRCMNLMRLMVDTPVDLVLFFWLLLLILFFHFNNQAVQEFYHLMVKKTYSCYPLTSVIPRSSRFLARRNLLAFDDGAVVVITEADLDGYDSNLDSRVAGSEIWADLNLIYRVRVASGAALARLSCMWLRCHADQKIPNQKLNAENKQLESFTVDIHVFSS